MFYEGIDDPYYINLFSHDRFYISVTDNTSKEPYFIVSRPNVWLVKGKYTRISFIRLRFIGKDRLNLTKKEMKQVIQILKKYRYHEKLIDYSNRVNKVEINNYINPDDYLKLIK